ALSRAWSGARDLSMAPVDGQPVIYQTIKRILDCIPQAEVKIAAPAFDHGGDLEFLAHVFDRGKVLVFYGHDSSPLNRIVDICEDLSEDDYVIRVDGLHFCTDLCATLKMLDRAKTECLDCVKLPDDFPVQFTSEVYRVGALRAVDKLLEGDAQAIFRVHPRFYIFARQDVFRCAYLQDLPSYSDEYLLQCREVAKTIYAEPRLEVNDRRIWAGD